MHSQTISLLSADNLTGIGKFISVEVPTTIHMDELSDDDDTITFEESNRDNDQTIPHENSPDESSEMDCETKRPHRL